MKVTSKKIAVFLNTLSTVLTYLVMFFVTPFVLKVLGKSDYGLYSLTTSIIGYLSLLSVGLTTAYVRFYFRTKSGANKYSIENLNGMYLITFLILSALVLVFGINLVVFSDRILGPKLSAEQYSTAKILMSILIFNLICSFMTSVFQSYLRAIQHFVSLELFILLKTVLGPLITIPLLLLGLGSIGYVIGSTIVAVLIEVSIMLYAFTKGKIKFNFKVYDTKIVREIFTYSIFIFGFQLFDQLNASVDNLVLSWTRGTEIISIYSIGSIISGVILALSSSILNVSIPEINKISSENKEEKLLQIMELQNRYGRMILLITLFVFSGFIVLGKPFLGHWVGLDFKDSFFVVILITTPKLFSNGMAIYSEYIKAENKHIARLIIYGVSILLNIGLSVPLGINYGVIGVSLGTFISFSLYVIFINFYYTIIIKLRLSNFWIQILRMLSIFSIYTGLSYIVSLYVDLDILWNFILFGFVYSVGLIFILYFLVLNTYEKRLIRQISRNSLRLASCKYMTFRDLKYAIDQMESMLYVYLGGTV